MPCFHGHCPEPSTVTLQANGSRFEFCSEHEAQGRARLSGMVDRLKHHVCAKCLRHCRELLLPPGECGCLREGLTFRCRQCRPKSPHFWQWLCVCGASGGAETDKGVFEQVERHKREGSENQEHVADQWRNI